jgi:hypothetical protein
MFRLLALIFLAFAISRFCRGVWFGYHGRPFDGGK